MRFTIILRPSIISPRITATANAVPNANKNPPSGVKSLSTLGITVNLKPTSLPIFVAAADFIIFPQFPASNARFGSINAQKHTKINAIYANETKITYNT